MEFPLTSWHPLIDGVFNHVQEHANHEIVVQVNADIILTQSFISSVNRLNNIVNGNPFLMIGRRWDLDVTTLIEYDDNGEWEDRIINQVKRRRKYFTVCQGSITGPFAAIPS